MRRFTLGVVLLMVGAGLSCGGAPAEDVPGDSSAGEPQSRTSRTGPTSPTSPTAGAGPGTDVVLVTIDTLRADALGFAGNDAVSTPNLDRLAREGRVFSSAYAHNVVTLPSHTNILTGLYPYQHGVRENSGFKLGSGVPTLATLLAAEGYATGAFVAAFPLDARFGLDRGFDVYDDRYPSGSRTDQFFAAERRGDEVIPLAVDWWRQSAGRPRFLWVHLYDPHAPYSAPEPFAGHHPGQPYLAEVEATDAYLEPLLSLFRETGSPPFVVVTADHGEALGDHGELTHGLFCYEATLKVPLVLWGAGVAPGVDERLAGHVDVVPTVLGVLGLEAPEGLAGRPLLSAEPSPKPLYFESLSSFFNRGWAPIRGVLEGRHKMIEVPLPELYDLSRDPREEQNLFSADRDRFQEMRRRLAAESPWPPEAREVSPAEVEALRSLGYLAGSAKRRTSFRPEDDPKRLVTLDQKLQRYILTYSEGRYEAAADLARQIVEERSDMALGYEHLAMALRQLERPAEAVAVLRAALDRGITDESLLRQLGWTYAENGLAEKAIEVLAPFADRDDPETLNALGIAYSDTGRHQEALAVLERSLGLDSNEPKTLETLGVVTLRLERVAEARSYLERALEINEDLPYSWNTLGVAHAYEGDPTAAMAAWERSIELDPRQYDALYNLGMTAARTGDRERARRALEQYVATAPPDRYGPDIAQARRALGGLR